MIGRMKKIVVLISGRGSNMVALARACREQNWPARIEAVIADREDAPGCEAARALGLRVEVVAFRQFPSRGAFDAALADRLEAVAPDVVALAGFMRVLAPDLVARYEGRMLNVHPSLLPAFPGLSTHRRVLEGGAWLHGATVHYVSAELDGGAIIAQAAVAVRPDDDATRLSARVLEAEHRIYPMAMAWHLAGRLRIEGHRVRLDGAQIDERQSIWLD